MKHRLKEFIDILTYNPIAQNNKTNYKLKVYVLAALCILILAWESHVIFPVQAIQTMNMAEEEFIPQESIRLRIKANSNSAIDQSIKINIRNAVNKEISYWVKDIPDLAGAREVIQQRIDELYEIVENELKKAGKNDRVEVSLQKTDFPTKLYGNRLYPAGEYEAVLITIGDGRGDNWWCVLFPPLCFLDFDNKNEDNPNHEEEEIEVSFFIVEIFKSLWERLTA